MKIRLLDLAERHLADSARFYEAQQPGLGGYFLDALFPTSTPWFSMPGFM